MEKKKLNISCSTVMLDVFIDCLFDGNLQLLDNEATKQELKQAWDSLCSEYSSLIGDNNQIYMINLSKEIVVLQSKILAAAIIIQESENKEAELKKIGYTGTPKKVESAMKRDSIYLANNIAELGLFKKNRQGGEKSTRENYLEWIISISKFIGYPINEKETTVAKFVTMSKIAEKTAKNNQNARR